MSKGSTPATLRAAAGKVDITPPVGVMLQGYARESGSTGLFERLYAKALVFDNGKQKIVLITSDLDAISPEVAADVRKGIVKAVPGIGPEEIMVSASHTHCGPAILNLVKMGGLDKPYLRSLRRKMIEMVAATFRRMEPVKIGTGSGRSFFNISRRLPTKNGLLFAPNPKGVCDHEVGVVRVDALDGTPRAILMNFTCHPTVMGGNDISPDYPGFAQKTVEARYKGRVVALFTNGTCGDIRPCFVKGRAPKTFGGGTRTAVKQAGTELGREVIRVAEKINTRFTTDLAGHSKVIRFPLEHHRPIGELLEQIETGKAKIRQLHKEGKGFLDIHPETVAVAWAQRTLRTVERKQFKPWVEGEIQRLRFGGINLVSLPGEVMCEIGMRIKKHFKPRKCFIATLTNGCIGYIPTARALVEGGYEPDRSTWYFGLPARFSPRVGDVIVNTVEALDERQ